VRRRHRHSEVVLDGGALLEGRAEARPGLVAAGGDGGHRFRTSLEWDPKMDAKGMIRRFPLEKDAVGRCLPLLLAVFDKSYLLNVILPRAVTAVGPDAGATLMLGVNTGEADDERLRDNAIHNYCRREFCQ
jgi:hypothetical protein